MLTNTEKRFFILFLILLAIDLICVNVESFSGYRYMSKPLVVLAILVFFISSTKHIETKAKRVTLLALLFSWIGDILLLFENESELFFMFGLISFLLAHISYSIVFGYKRDKKRRPLLFVILLLSYALVLFSFLKDGLNDMLIPVLIYMLAILIMALMAYYRKGSVGKLSYRLVFVGAILFMLSDSILALDKFYQPLALSKIGIMLTYGLAQFLIVLGVLKEFKSTLEA